jgi:hypothetical protein
MKFLTLTAFFSILFLAASGQKFTVTADKNRILIGEPFELTLQAGFTGELPATWPEPDTIPHFEILERYKIDTQQKGNSIVLTQIFKCTSWDSGRWQLPSFQLGTQRSLPVIMEVGYSPMEPGQAYHDIKEIINVKKEEEAKWWWYLIGVAVLAILFLLFFPGSRKKEKPEFVSDEGAYKKALRQLAELEAKPDTDAKMMYTELILIFRTYLQKRKNIQSFSRTTDDLAIKLNELNLGQEEFTKLVQVLRTSDLAKFARYEPPASENKESIAVVKESITAIEKL